MARRCRWKLRCSDFLILIMVFLAFVALPPSIADAITFDKAGWFEIDLPEGYELSDTKNNRYSFKKENSPTINVSIVPSDAPKFEYLTFFSAYMEAMKETLTKDPPPTYINLSKVTVNGVPGICGALNGKMLVNKVGIVGITNSLCSANLQKGAVAVYSSYLSERHREMEHVLKQTFSSLRKKGSEVSGIKDEKAITQEEFAAMTSNGK